MINRKNLRGISAPIALSIGIIFAFFPITAKISYDNIQDLRANSLKIAHTHDTMMALQEFFSAIQDAETGQRGFALTGDENYLIPYNTALSEINARLENVKKLSADTPEINHSIELIKLNLDNKLKELAETIKIRRTQGFDSTLEVIKSNRGKQAMDNIRTNIASIATYEQETRQKHMLERDRIYQYTTLNAFLICLIGVTLSSLFFYFIRRHNLANQKQAWLKDGENEISKVLMGNLTSAEIGNNILRFLADYMNIQAGTFYVRNGTKYKLVSTYGVKADANVPEDIKENDGLLLQATLQNRIIHLYNIPDNYFNIGSSLGHSKPHHLAIIPTGRDGDINSVIELGVFDKINETDFELLKQCSEAIGVAIRAAEYRSHLQDLYEETERQAEELQVQSEELRVSNEELEEQSSTLKESQSRLEQQQHELEQINSELEEQTLQLSIQKDDLEHAHIAVQRKAEELERASQYKSDFLANMSHELRTPLNSSLILSKLLADNPLGNLTDEQVKFATTIQSSGNDLLTLINSILDLSKIEAGHMEVAPEVISLKTIADNIKFTFEAMAKEKGLNLLVLIEPKCPDTIYTDRLRLEQIIKNLVSNALKFTQNGHVILSIENESDNKISFAVKDTGIGISPEQQQFIFDPFRQADGTTSRKYGGTGLGLSISRELSRLLGGTITVKSVEGQGSAFTITIPVEFDEKNFQEVRNSPASTLLNALHQTASNEAKKTPTSPLYQKANDDRDNLSQNKHSILVIEDDASFSKIIYDLAHELNFDCLIATTAEESLILAKQYLPNAIILDVGLPDHSGLSVLDRLKRNAHTRHIPIHVVSADDYSQVALSLGAVGHMLKPVQREQLAETLRQMETRFSQTMRRILLVEDDEVQRDSIRHLLKTKDVDIVDVGTAAECLEKLENDKFDCMVLDLSLPDATGHALLETLSNSDDHSFPPVIVYTGRDLSSQEEQLLRRYSKSIIIKGAKSPERLLDEVTLFLHQIITDLPAEQQNMLKKAQSRDAALENRRILIVEDDIRNIYSLTNILEPHGVRIDIARNGVEALTLLDKTDAEDADKIDMVLMDVMMPEMDGITATKEIRKRAEWKKLPIIMLTAKAMRDDQERCLSAGANDYMAKPLDIEKLLSLVRVWMAR